MIMDFGMSFGFGMFLRQTRRAFGVVSVAAFLFLLSPRTAFAQEISVDAALSSASVELGAAVRFTITVNGVDDPPAVQLPKINGLEIRYLGPSTKISIINGKMSRSTGMMFSVIPQRTGTFEIPPIEIVLNGRDFKTPSLSLTVHDPGQGQTATPGSSSSLQDKIFIVLSPAKTEAYVNEPIPVTVRLFISGIAVKNVQYPALEAPGFVSESFVESRRGQQTLGDTVYSVIEFRSVIYPSQAGQLELGPARLGANIRITAPRGGSARGRFGDLFGEDIFEEFFGGTEVQTLPLESAKVGIHVREVPQEGKPAGYSGGVGKYQFEMSVSPSAVKVGDPLTIRMRVAGDGNLRVVEMPAFADSKDFRAYDPKITEQGNEKYLEQVLIPKHDGVREVPAVDFSYFDTVEGKYFSVTRGPFPIDVSPLGKEEGPKVVGAALPLSPVLDQPELGKDIYFIKENPGVFRRQGTSVLNHPGFVSVCVLFLFGWIALVSMFYFQRTFSPDHHLIRRLKAPRRAKAGLSTADASIAAGDCRGFYEAVSKVMKEYFANKFQLAEKNLSLERVLSRLKQDDPSRADIEALWKEIEMVRFASLNVPEQNMRTTLLKISQLIDHCERSYR